MKLRLRESRAALPQIQQKAPEGASCQRFRIESLLGIGETLTRGNDFLFGGVSTSPVVARQDFLAGLVIERTGWLIAQQQLRLFGNRAGDGYTLDRKSVV